MKKFIVSLLISWSLIYAPAYAIPGQIGFWQKAASGTPPAIVNNWKNHAATTSTAVTVSPTTGSLLVVGLVGYQTTTALFTVTDNGSNTYTLVSGNDGSTSPSSVQIYYLKNCPAGITTITGTSGAGSLASVCFVFEVSGCSASAPFTTGEYVSTNGGAGGTTNPTTGTVTFATANSILFAILGNADGGNPATLTVNSTGSSGGTWALYNSTNSQETNGGTYMPGSMPYVVISSSGTAAHGWTTANKGGQAMVAAAFHP